MGGHTRCPVSTPQSLFDSFPTTKQMPPPQKERWIEVAEQVAVEQDPVKLQELYLELDDLLEEKRRRLGIIPSKKKS